MQAENPVCSVNLSISQHSLSQVKRRNGPALPAIQLHAHRDYPYSGMRKKHSIETPTSKQRLSATLPKLSATAGKPLSEICVSAFRASK